MKRNGILNSEISTVLSCMGHTDQICIADCGLPIPEETKKIDLALKFGVPSFLDVLKETVNDMKVEKIILAEEIKEKNPEILKELKSYFNEFETGFKTEIQYISHEELKKMTKKCKAVIRTGENTP